MSNNESEQPPDRQLEQLECMRIGPSGMLRHRNEKVTDNEKKDMRLTLICDIEKAIGHENIEFKEYNFRENMPRKDDKLQKKPLKRLQAGPRLTRNMKSRKGEADKVLERLINKVIEDDVTLVMENLQRYAVTRDSRGSRNSRKTANVIQKPEPRIPEDANVDNPVQLEEVSTMMESLKMGEEEKAEGRGKNEVLEEPNKDSSWEDFGSLEEELEIIRQLEIAELRMFEEMKDAEEKTQKGTTSYLMRKQNSSKTLQKPPKAKDQAITLEVS